ncbi:hypothetical protein L596_012485 [Steinernema carpocapsae]|uniref:Uncharacterized protein n=1 Tax=Steinernema carpocapsae TaxID=34508 RepID=A0A4U5NY32_STECR|nr:hypothetical protein L596_012485 [Steinernema carpocapsae]
MGVSLRRSSPDQIFDRPKRPRSTVQKLTTTFVSTCAQSIDPFPPSPNPKSPLHPSTLVLLPHFPSVPFFPPANTKFDLSAREQRSSAGSVSRNGKKRPIFCVWLRSKRTSFVGLLVFYLRAKGENGPEEHVGRRPLIVMQIQKVHFASRWARFCPLLRRRLSRQAEAAAETTLEERKRRRTILNNVEAETPPFICIICGAHKKVAHTAKRNDQRWRTVQAFGLGTVPRDFRKTLTVQERVLGDQNI